MSIRFENTLSFAEKLDRDDKLSSARNLFHIPQKNGKDSIYLCGNSLGLQPKAAKKYILQELEDWKDYGVDGHLEAKDPWLYYHHQFKKPMANLVGAQENEVVLMNTLTVNLHLMMASFYRPKGKRTKILVENKLFPSDRFALESHLRREGLHPNDHLIELDLPEGSYQISTEDILAKIDAHKSELALIMIGGVNYYSGQLFDMEQITKAGHKVGAMVGFDLAHATGNVPMELHNWKVDFAVWCGYKYLNSGPGGPSGVFVHEKHGMNPDTPKFAGWWGHKESIRFEMGKNYIPMMGADAWQLSNAQILAKAPQKASFEIFEKYGIKALREKSINLTGFLEFLLLESGIQGLKIITPNDKDARGCQLSILTGENGRKIFDGITQDGVIADWREPNVIRVAPVPLYNTYTDVFNFVEALKRHA